MKLTYKFRNRWPEELSQQERWALRLALLEQAHWAGDHQDDVELLWEAWYRDLGNVSQVVRQFSVGTLSTTWR